MSAFPNLVTDVGFLGGTEEGKRFEKIDVSNKIIAVITVAFWNILKSFFLVRAVYMRGHLLFPITCW